MSESSYPDKTDISESHCSISADLPDRTVRFPTLSHRTVDIWPTVDYTYQSDSGTSPASLSGCYDHPASRPQPRPIRKATLK